MLKVPDMNRLLDILLHCPQGRRQSQSHRWAATVQRAMSPGPVVQIPPQPQRPLQRPAPSRTVAGPPAQPSYLAAHGSVQSLDGGGVDRLADMQLSDTLANFFQSAEQGSCPYLLPG